MSTNDAQFVNGQWVDTLETRKLHAVQNALANGHQLGTWKTSSLALYHTAKCTSCQARVFLAVDPIGDPTLDDDTGEASMTHPLFWPAGS